jgi:hypothetical protein
MRTRPADPLPSGGMSAVRGVRREATSPAGPTSTAPAPGRMPGVLDVAIRRRGNVVELSISGALDRATAPRLGEAMALARGTAGTRRSARLVGDGDRRPRHEATIVIDTGDVARVDSVGYQALEAELVGPNGLWDPGVAWIVGPAVAAFEMRPGSSASHSHVLGSPPNRGRRSTPA